MKGVGIKILSLLISMLTLFSIGASYSQVPKTLLWQISGNGLEQVSYLYGTFHLLCHEYYTPEDTLYSIFEKVDRLVLEVNVDDPAIIGLLDSSILMEKDHLRDLLPPDDYDMVARFFIDSAGLSLHQMGNHKPLFLKDLVTTQMLGCDPVSMEDFLAEEFSGLGKKITGLAGKDGKLAFNELVTEEAQAKLLLEEISKYDHRLLTYKEMIACYKTRDLEQIRFHLETNQKGYQALMIDSANVKWLPKIESFIRTGPSFIALGAGHLGGKGGLLALLRQKGYSLTPIP